MIQPINRGLLDTFVAFRNQAAKECKYIKPMTRERAAEVFVEYSTSNKLGFLVIDGNTCVGQLFLNFESGDFEASLRLISVLCSHQRQGFGTQLVELAKQEAAKRKTALSLFVHVDNTEAIVFYYRQGFAIEKKYGKNILMTLR